MGFGNDWNGVFIRGDDAFMYKMSLDTIVELVKKLPPELIDVDLVIAMRSLHGLIETLAESNQGDDRNAKAAKQVMNPYQECLVKRNGFGDGEDEVQPQTTA